MILPIVRYPDPFLRKKTVPVPENWTQDPGLAQDIHFLWTNMWATMKQHKAAGVAANQVGSPYRVFLVHQDESLIDSHIQPVVFINPQILAVSEEIQVGKEGCLSFPGVYIDVKRPARATVSAMDTLGNSFSVETSGFFARAILHEYDHLEGRLLVDSANYHHKDRIKRKAKQWAREAKRQAIGSAP